MSDAITVGAYVLGWGLVAGWAFIFTVNCCTRESRECAGVENRSRCDARIAELVAEQERT